MLLQDGNDAVADLVAFGVVHRRLALTILQIGIGAGNAQRLDDVRIWRIALHRIVQRRIPLERIEFVDRFGSFRIFPLRWDSIPDVIVLTALVPILYDGGVVRSNGDQILPTQRACVHRWVDHGILQQDAVDDWTPHIFCFALQSDFLHASFAILILCRVCCSLRSLCETVRHAAFGQHGIGRVGCIFDGGDVLPIVGLDNGAILDDDEPVRQ
mmetsp:Transcript_10712/g.30605  ORF Transcript_10712/g.30605 Transcript_10712/m.30605 type:complete len:213 (+) Transcript_10712:690-1328(+)